MEYNNNDNYKVVFDITDLERPYHVVNKATGFSDYRATNLPQALVISEQFNQIISSGDYKTMFMNDDNPFFFEDRSEEEDNWNH